MCGIANGLLNETDPRAPDTPELCSENCYSLRPKATSTACHKPGSPARRPSAQQPPPQLSPGQEGGQVVGRGGVRAQGRRGHERRCLGPVLAPVVGAVRAQAGRDGLAENEGALGDKRDPCGTSERSLVGRAGTQTRGTSETRERGWPKAIRRPSFSQASHTRPRDPAPRPPAPG